MKKINLKLKEVKVEAKAVSTKFTQKIGTPIFGMSKEARKSWGLLSPIKYWFWKMKMRKNWKTK